MNSQIDKDSKLIDRENYIKKVTKELRFFNFGLPPDPKTYNSKSEDIIKKYKALQELYVRMNLYKTNGMRQEGSITFNEANKIIDYLFNDVVVNDSYVRFRSMKNIK